MSSKNIMLQIKGRVCTCHITKIDNCIKEQDSNPMTKGILKIKPSPIYYIWTIMLYNNSPTRVIFVACKI